MCDVNKSQEINVYQPKPGSTVSHELRIPLTGILGMLYLLNKTNLTEQQQESIQIIQSCAEQLLTATSKISELLNEGVCGNSNLSNNI